MPATSDDPTPYAGLRKGWDIARRVVLGVFTALAVAAALTGAVRLSVASELRSMCFAWAGLAVLFGTIEEILERWKWIPKQPKIVDRVELRPPRRRASVPIAAVATLDPFAAKAWAARDRESLEKDPLTPLRGGALPGAFDRAGAKAIWSLEPGRREADSQDAVR